MPTAVAPRASAFRASLPRRTPPVDEHRDAAAHPAHDLDQHTDRRLPAFFRATAVVGDDEAVHAVAQRLLCVLLGHDAFIELDHKLEVSDFRMDYSRGVHDWRDNPPGGWRWRRAEPDDDLAKFEQPTRYEDHPRQHADEHAGEWPFSSC
jgi:hypothetical protein